MKNVHILFAFIGMLTFSACQHQSKTNNETQPENVTEESALVTYTIQVEGMTCTGCENTVKSSVSELTGIQEVKASYTDSTAVVKFNPSETSIDEIAQTIEKKGYQVKETAMLE